MALVEMAVIAPVFFMLVFGMLSGGLLYNQKLQLSHAAREGARHAAALSEAQAFASGNWVENVRSVVIQRSNGELTAAQVCVALVQGVQPTVVTTTTGTVTTQHSTNGTQPCYDDSAGGQSQKRVQVQVRKPGTLDVVFFRYPVDLTARSNARHEF